MQTAGDVKVVGKATRYVNVIDFLKKYGVGLALVVLIVLNCVITPNFMSVNNMWNIVIQSSTVMLVALGMTIVIATGGIDISVGSIMALSSVAFVHFLPHGVWVSLVAAIVVALFFGFVNGGVAAFFRIEPLIVTLATMIMIRGIAQLITDGRVVGFIHTEFTQIGYYRIGGIVPIQLVIVAVAIVVVYFLLKKMTFGRYVEAIGDNRKAAQLAGINIHVTLIWVYVIAALMAGFAGIMETARLSAADANNMGMLIELDAIAAVAIGGTILTGGRAYLWGTIAGVYIMQIITTMVNMNNIPHAYSMVVKTLIIIFAVYIQRSND